MATKATTVEMTVHSDLIESSYGETGGVPVTLAYTADQPYSVHLQFNTLDGSVPWEFSRELLREALERDEAGHGDVRTMSHGGNVMVAFIVKTATQDAFATFRFDRGDLRAFLRSTERLVKFGAEVVDFDAELDALLKDDVR